MSNHWPSYYAAIIVLPRDRQALCDRLLLFMQKSKTTKPLHLSIFVLQQLVTNGLTHWFSLPPSPCLPGKIRFSFPTRGIRKKIEKCSPAPASKVNILYSHKFLCIQIHSRLLFKIKPTPPPLTTSKKPSKDSDIYFSFSVLPEFTQEVSTWPGTKAQDFQIHISIPCQRGQYNLPSTLPHPTVVWRCLHPTCSHFLAEVGREIQAACLVVKYHLLHLQMALHQLPLTTSP